MKLMISLYLDEVDTLDDVDIDDDVDTELEVDTLQKKNRLPFYSKRWRRDTTKNKEILSNIAEMSA